MTRECHVRFCEGGGVRFPSATRLIVGFQYRSDAERFRDELRQRLATFALELHPDKTRLIAFGKFACSNREERGLKGKPETFNFLGLTHIGGRSRGNRFLLRRQTERKRMTAKLHAVSTELQRRRHQSIPAQGRWLSAVVRGHCAYYGVPTNAHALCAFRTQVARCWCRALRRRSQRHRLDWTRTSRYVRRWLPPARIPGPSLGSTFAPKVRAQCGSPARWDLCGGRPEPSGEGPSLPRPDRRPSYRR